MTDNQLNLNAADLRVFVPALDFEQSLRFYTLLGWKINWTGDDNGLAILEFANVRFFLQNHYVKDWADNFMFQVLVDDVEAWHKHVSQIQSMENFNNVRIRPPTHEDYGAITMHVIDPSGVLIHFSQFLNQ